MRSPMDEAMARLVATAQLEWAERRLGRGPGRDRRTERWKLDDLATDIIEAVEFAPSTEDPFATVTEMEREMDATAEVQSQPPASNMGGSNRAPSTEEAASSSAGDYMWTACASTPTPKASEDAREHTGECMVVPYLEEAHNEPVFVRLAPYEGPLGLDECWVASDPDASEGYLVATRDMAGDLQEAHYRIGQLERHRAILQDRLSQPEPHTPSGDADSSCNEAQIAMTEGEKAWVHIIDEILRERHPGNVNTDTVAREIVGRLIGTPTPVQPTDSTPEGRDPDGPEDAVTYLAAAMMETSCSGTSWGEQDHSTHELWIEAARRVTDHRWSIRESAIQREERERIVAMVEEEIDEEVHAWKKQGSYGRREQMALGVLRDRLRSRITEEAPDA